MAKLMLRQGEVLPDYIDAVKRAFEIMQLNEGCDTDCCYDYCHEFGSTQIDMNCIKNTCGCYRDVNTTEVFEIMSELEGYKDKINNISTDIGNTFRESIQKNLTGYQKEVEKVLEEFKTEVE